MFNIFFVKLSKLIAFLCKKCYILKLSEFLYIKKENIL